LDVLETIKPLIPRTCAPRLEIATAIAPEASESDEVLRELFYRVRRSHPGFIDTVSDETLRTASAVDGLTALHVAVVSKSLPSVVAMLERQVLVDARDFEG
jgi:hypothetical protein